MGTSASSSGPGGGVPFDPPWIDNIGNPQSDDGIQPNGQGNANTVDDDQEGNGLEQLSQPTAKPPQSAPRGRFQSARRNLGDFVHTGNRNSFRKAVGHYSRTGMGGARNSATRMRASTRSAANLFDVLKSARERTDPVVNEWVTSLSSRNASTQDVVDEIIRLIAPSGGSQDETSCRESMAQAMEDLLEENSNTDLFHLGDNDIWALIESFLGYEAYYRLCLDLNIEEVFKKSQLNLLDRVSRMNEMQEYLKAEFCAQIEELRHTTPQAASNQLQVVLQSAVQNTFLVYEGSL